MSISRGWMAGFACLEFWGGAWNVLYGATYLTVVPSIHPCMLPLSLLFPGGFEFAPGPWVGNSWCLLASFRRLGRDVGFQDVTGRVGVFCGD